MKKEIQAQILSEIENILADGQLGGYVQARDIYIVMRYDHGTTLAEEEITALLDKLSWLKCEEGKYRR